MDLLNWQPPCLVPVVPQEQVRSGTLRGRLARTVALMLKECALSRGEIAKRMGEFLGEEVSVAMLNNYASQAREEHSISAPRLSALTHVTGDLRAMQILVEPFDHAIIAARYVPAVEQALLQDKIEELQQLHETVKRSRKAVRS